MTAAGNEVVMTVVLGAEEQRTRTPIPGDTVTRPHGASPSRAGQAEAGLRRWANAASQALASAASVLAVASSQARRLLAHTSHTIFARIYTHLLRRRPRRCATSLGNGPSCAEPAPGAEVADWLAAAGRQRTQQAAP